MTVSIELSAEAEELLKAEWGDLNQAAWEALVIESYRQGKLSFGQCSEVHADESCRDGGVPARPGCQPGVDGPRH